MAKDIEKDTKKHYPPAYYRYREKNRTISILLSKEVKAALDKARGNMSYAKFLKSLFTPDGVFSQFQKQTAQLASEKVSLESEIKKQRAQLESDRVSLENGIKKQTAQLASERVSLENEKKNLAKIERFSTPCVKCGKQMLFENTDSNWNSEIKPQLWNAFFNYFHENCVK